MMIILTFGNRLYCLQWTLDFVLLYYCFVASCCVVFIFLLLFIAAFSIDIFTSVVITCSRAIILLAMSARLNRDL